MAFEKYKPCTHTAEPTVWLRKQNLSFNIPASKMLKWDRINIAVDKLSGHIAISEAPKDEGLKVYRSKKWGNAAIGVRGIIKFFGLERLIGCRYKIEDKKDMILLTPQRKTEPA